MDLFWMYLGLSAVCYFSSLVVADKKDVKCPTLRLPGGRVRYQSKRKVARFVCDTGSTLVGPDLAVCAYGQWSVPMPSCVGATCLLPSIDPLVNVESFKSGGLLQFFCPPGYIRDGPETIACSGGKWDAQPPTCEVGMSQGCDFEDGLCGWSDDLTDDFNWKRFNGKTPTVETGPNVDHTKNDSTGHYIFVESSAPQVSGNKARFLSPFYTTLAIDGKCLQFYYHMFGEDGAGLVGDLDVYLRPQLLPTKALGSDHQIFHKSGNQNDKWIKETVLIPKLTDPTQIVFQATIRNSWVSDIALDDILITDCDKNDADNKVFNDLVTSAQVSTSLAPDEEAKTQRSSAPTKTTKALVKTTRPPPRVTTKVTRASTTVKATPVATTKPTTASTPETTTTVAPTTTTRTSATSTVSTTAIPTTTRTTISSTTKPTTTRTSPTTVTTPSIPTSRSTTSEEAATTLSSTSSTDQTTLAVETPAPSTAVEDPETPSMETSAQPADASTDFTSSIEETTSEATNATNTDDNPDEDYTNVDAIDERKRKVDEDSEDSEDTDESDNEVNTNSTVGDNSEDEDSTDNDSRDSGNSPTDLYGNNAASGKVLAGDESSSAKELLPLIIGVISAVVVGAVVIGVLTWRWAKHQRMKQQKEEEDQMNIITEYVETTLN